MVVVGEDGVTMLGILGPLIVDHCPVPDDGVFPAIVVEVPHLFCLGPATAAVTSFTVIGCDTVVVPQLLVTPSEILKGPNVLYVIAPGLGLVDEPGEPPVKVHA